VLLAALAAHGFSNATVFVLEHMWTEAITMTLPFEGSALALSSDGLAGFASSLGVHAPEIWAVLTVETKGCGYLPDRRPQILYERHIFHRLTRGQFDDGDISDRSPGGYGPTGAHQYERLAAAIKKDASVRTIALQSASWDLGQIMGENFAAAGFDNVEDMVTAMSKSEDAQLEAMGSFLTATKLRASLRAHDWTTFAPGYNGANFAINRYDVRLNGEFQTLSVGVLPDLIVRCPIVSDVSRLPSWTDRWHCGSTRCRLWRNSRLSLDSDKRTQSIRTRLSACETLCHLSMSLKHSVMTHSSRP
jgi:N-acetylmuramidase